MKINMDCKEEISDSDSGIILNSGPDSPTSPVKDLSSHMRVLRLKQQSLENRLELCVLELNKLCVREAELTGKLPCNAPLLPHEKPAHIRRGACFKLNEGFMSQDGEWCLQEQHILETAVTPQWQIYKARKLSVEENDRRSRLQCKREETLKALQQKHHSCSSRQTDAAVSDDSSLSDAVAVDDDLDSSPVSAAVLSSSTDSSFQNNGPKPSSSGSSLDYEPSVSPELLDQPQQKAGASLSACSSRSSSPTFSPDSRLAELPPAPQFVFRSLPVRNPQANSAASSPDLPPRPRFSQPCRLPRGRPGLGRPSSDFAPAFSLRRVCRCSSDDSSSELSTSSFSSSSSREAETLRPRPPPYGHAHTSQRNPSNSPAQPEPRTGPNPQSGTGPANKAQQVQLTSAEATLRPPPPYTKVLRAVSLRQNLRWRSADVPLADLDSRHHTNRSLVPRCHSLERQKRRPEPPPYRRIHAQQVPHRLVLLRAPDGTPLQWYEEEDSEIVSQV